MVVGGGGRGVHGYAFHGDHVISWSGHTSFSRLKILQTFPKH